MCIVIDANVFSRVFDPKNSEHDKFKPVLNWIVVRDGKMITGGTKYNEEVFIKIKKFNKLLSELKKKRKLIQLKTEIVDAKAAHFKTLVTASDFDDPHIISILAVSNVNILCTLDQPLASYARNSIFYQKKHKKVAIYKCKADKYLLKHKDTNGDCATVIT